MEVLYVLGKILVVDLVLSGDNAVVIAMASKNLPEKQRKQAVWWGTMGAVILRCILTCTAVFLLGIPFIQAVGSALLLWIALKLLLEQEQQMDVNEAFGVWSCIQIILIADFVMSLDNVLGIAALANGDLALIVIGLSISIPIVVWGSGIITQLLRRFPQLLFVGSAILAFTAGEMLLRDPKVGGWLSTHLQHSSTVIPLFFVVLVTIVEFNQRWMHKKHR